MTDLYEITIRDNDNGNTVETLGRCLTGNASKALEMYQHELEKWYDANYMNVELVARRLTEAEAK
jgi:hypothetical protein